MSKRALAAYPKPGPVGGRLIRDLIGFVRGRGLKLPVTSHILIGCSGGADSTALAVLLAKYGRRVADPQRITLVYLDHGWRPESAEEGRRVRSLARSLGVGFKSRKLSRQYLQKKGVSWEDGAREARKAAWARLLKGAPRGATVWTAHHGDDLAETVLWRLLTGTAATHGGGIAFHQDFEVRPLLFARKRQLEAFLREEGVPWSEDPTNRDPRFLRAAMRLSIFPELERLFPRGVERLVEQALRAQTQAPGQVDVLGGLLGAAGLRARRGNWVEIQKALRSGKRNLTLSLPEGWKLTRVFERPKKAERWVLERDLC